MSTDFNNKSQEIPNILVCECGKVYKERSGLWRHKQKCKPDEESDEENTKKDELAELVKYLMKENSEMKNMMLEQSNLMMEVIKNGTMQNSHNTTTNTNSHNKAFNLQFFLNETCKDAMNITDFVESIKLQLSDLERVGELGYVEGISNIIVKNLKDLDVTQRPVHCTDQKREVMYVKDEGKWDKEDEENKFSFLIAVGGQVFEIADDMSVTLDSTGFYGVGSGSPYAIGALEAGATVQQALEIAAKNDAYTSSPFLYFTQPKKV
jgi:hypothetical protein